MVYLPTIPAANDKPAQSQSEIQENFTQLNSQFLTEHVAFNAAADNGQHKFVTLRRSAGVVPVGDNMVIAQALTPAGNPYVQALNATSIFSIPLVYTTTVAVLVGTSNLIDFAALGLVPQAGTLFVYDTATVNKTILSPFVYDGVGVVTPGTTGQLISGGDLLRFVYAGTVLQLITTIATTVSLRVIGTAI